MSRPQSDDDSESEAHGSLPSPRQSHGTIRSRSASSASLSPGHKMLPEVDKNVGPDVSIDLRNARQLLEAKDAILEPGLMATVVDFVSSGGDGGEVPLLLARGLVGYPQMTRLLCDWLVIAGVPEVEIKAIAWNAARKEVGKRLDARSLDDSTVRSLTLRPKFIDTLLANHQGRSLVIELYDSTDSQNDDYGRSDLLCHCLREMAVCGHISELLQAETLDLCDDWCLFEAALVESIFRATKWNGGPAPSIETLVTDILRCCGLRIEARCYANRLVEILRHATGTSYDLLWRTVRQDRRVLAMPPLPRLGNSPLQLQHLQPLKDSVISFARSPTANSLDAARTAFDFTPCVSFLRAPDVLAALFRLAFDPVLATIQTINTAAHLISAVTTAPPEADDYSCGTAAHEVHVQTAHAAAAAVISAAAQACLSEALTNRPTQDSPESSGALLVSATRNCAAARHGVLIWIVRMLKDHIWLRTRLHKFASSALLILQAAALSPGSRHRVFIAYQRMVDAPHAATPISLSKCHAPEPYDPNGIGKSAVFGLVNLAAIWDCAPDILHFVEMSDSVSGTLLKSFIIRLGKKARPPYSALFASAAASLLACDKARHIWRNTEGFPPKDLSSIRDFAMNVAISLQDGNYGNACCAFLARLGVTSDSIAAVPPKSGSTTADAIRASVITKPLKSTGLSPTPSSVSQSRQCDSRTTKRRSSDDPHAPAIKRLRGMHAVMFQQQPSNPAESSPNPSQRNSTILDAGKTMQPISRRTEGAP